MKNNKKVKNKENLFNAEMDLYSKVKHEAIINDSILCIFEMPIDELDGEIREAMIACKNNNLSSWESGGKVRSMEFFREAMVDEVLKWRKINEELNI